MDDADDVIEVVAVHREPGERALPEELDDARDRGVVGHGHDLGPRDHDLAYERLGEVERVADQDPL